MRAILSVFDKAGVVEFAQGLSELGVQLISTGGTATALKKAGLAVTEVSDITGFPECLDGRVKTLHPLIHAGILAMRGNAEHMEQLNQLGVETIDIIAVNLYPFKQTVAKPCVTFEEAVENIDIGGPTMLRAAAKNWQDVAVMVDPADYAVVLDELKKNGHVSRDTKRRLQYKVFEHTANYDAMIFDYLRKQQGIQFPETLTVTYERQQDLRYGENPHQNAVFYREVSPAAGSLAAAEQLHGKELSYNNIGDANGALDLLREFSETTVVAVKHATPCGVGSAPTLLEAWTKAYETDPMSIYGGIVAINTTVDAATAAEMGKIFLEVVIAPDYAPEALDILGKKKNIRLLKLPGIAAPVARGTFDMKKVLGGLLVQEMDLELLHETDLKVVTKRAPTEQEMKDLLFTWKIVKHTKSNAIVVGREGQSLGIGGGQVNRFWPTQQALERSGEKVKGAVLASDAFFPFDDCVREAAKYGVTAIIQPGGAGNDKASIDACDEAGIAMVFTGMRHFKHS